MFIKNPARLYLKNRKEKTKKLVAVSISNWDPKIFLTLRNFKDLSFQFHRFFFLYQVEFFVLF